MNLLSQLYKTYQKYTEGIESQEESEESENQVKTVNKENPTRKSKKKKRRTRKRNKNNVRPNGMNNNSKDTNSLGANNNSDTNNGNFDIQLLLSRSSTLPQRTKTEKVKKNEENKNTKKKIKTPPVLNSFQVSKSKRGNINTKITRGNRSPLDSSMRSTRSNDICEQLKHLGELLKTKYHIHLVTDSEKHMNFQQQISENGPVIDRMTLLDQLDVLITKKKKATDITDRKLILDEINEINEQLSKKGNDNRYDILNNIDANINNLNAHSLFQEIKKKVPQYYVPDASELEASLVPVIHTDKRVSHLILGIMFECIGFITKLVLSQSQNDTHIFLSGGRALQIKGMPKSKSFDLDLLFKSRNQTKESKKELALCIANILLDICSLDGLYGGTGKLSMTHHDEKNLIKIAYSYTYPGSKVSNPAEALVDITYHQENSPTHDYFDTDDKYHTRTIYKGFSVKGRNYNTLYITQMSIQMFLEKLNILNSLCKKEGDKICLHDSDDDLRVKKSLATLLLIEKNTDQTKNSELAVVINKNRNLLDAYKYELMEEED